MKLTVVPMLALLALAACGERTDAPAATPVEKVSAVNPASDGEASVPVVLTAPDLRRVCQAGLAAIHGQWLTDISIDGLDGQVVNASWRAPVDGGRRRAQCRVDGDLVTWKPADARTPEADRWMNQAGDPVMRFILDGETITINTTMPDGVVSKSTFDTGSEAKL